MKLKWYEKYISAEDEGAENYEIYYKGEKLENVTGLILDKRRRFKQYD